MRFVTNVPSADNLLTDLGHNAVRVEFLRRHAAELSDTFLAWSVRSEKVHQFWIGKLL